MRRREKDFQFQELYTEPQMDVLDFKQMDIVCTSGGLITSEEGDDGEVKFGELF